MDKHGLYDYGLLQKGSYFGDISLMQDMPNTFSYMFNPHGNHSLVLFSVEANKFMDIINHHPLGKEVFV